MSLFVIAYDLVKRKDYPELWGELKRLKAQKVLLSTYLADLNNTAQEVLDHLKGYLSNSDDRLMVIEFSKRPAWTAGLKGTRDSIKSHFP